ncbi:MAG: SH3 domain-containing protein [Saprospiraceae bacterium]
MAQGTMPAAIHKKYGYGRINAARAVQMAQGLAGGGGTASTGNTGSTGNTSTPSGNLKGKVTSNYLNVRSGPSTSYAKVGRLNKGDIIDLVEKVSGF